MEPRKTDTQHENDRSKRNEHLQQGWAMGICMQHLEKPHGSWTYIQKHPGQDATLSKQNGRSNKGERCCATCLTTKPKHSLQREGEGTPQGGKAITHDM